MTPLRSRYVTQSEVSRCRSGGRGDHHSRRVVRCVGERPHDGRRGAGGLHGVQEGWKQRKSLAAALRPVSPSSSSDAASDALRALAASPWGQQYPTRRDHTLPRARDRQRVDARRAHAECGSRSRGRIDWRFPPLARREEHGVSYETRVCLAGHCGEKPTDVHPHECHPPDDERPRLPQHPSGHPRNRERSLLDLIEHKAVHLGIGHVAVRAVRVQAEHHEPP